MVPLTFGYKFPVMDPLVYTFHQATKETCVDCKWYANGSAFWDPLYGLCSVKYIIRIGKLLKGNY